MTICVLNSGSVQSISRAITLSKYAEVVRFIETGTITENHNSLTKEGILVHSFKSRGFKALALAKLLRKITADVFLCFYASGVHVDACLYARKKCIVIVAMGSDILETNRKRLGRLKIKYGIKEASLISAKSQDIINRIKSLRVKTDCYLNYWGLDLQNYSELSKNDARKKLGLPLESKILLSPRAFHEFYNIKLVAEAFLELNKEINNLYFLFIGRVIDLTYMKKINDLMGSVKGIKFRIDGNISEEKVKYYYKASDIVYSFARRDGFPNTVLETFAAETNMVIGGIDNLKNSFLKDNENVVFSDFIHQDIVLKSKMILTDSALSQSLKSNALQTVIKYGNINKNAKELAVRIEKCKSFSKRFPITLFVADVISIIFRAVRLN
ncbi:MAG: glycosyltransferase [Bacteroidales bacterium]|nr:glycosyltransferase [Bacteroidales bacterium]